MSFEKHACMPMLQETWDEVSELFQVAVSELFQNGFKF
jgi:hypothetical protein